MSTFPPFDSFKEHDQAKEPGKIPKADEASREHESNEQTRRGNPVGFCDSDEDKFETFMDGAGL